MLDTLEANELPNAASTAATTSTAATALTIGADLRRRVEADPHETISSAIKRVGDIDVQLARNGAKWRLYLQNLVPVPHTVRDLWATAVAAPSVEWSQTPDGCLVWCEWTVSGQRGVDAI